MKGRPYGCPFCFGRKPVAESARPERIGLAGGRGGLEAGGERSSCDGTDRISRRTVLGPCRDASVERTGAALPRRLRGLFQLR